jgi:nucleoside-diphosphate-sugar epimerase
VQLAPHSLVLVTGSAGRIGRATIAALAAGGWRVRGFDLQPTPGAAESVIGDLQDPEAVRDATAGAAAVVHLGGVPDDEDFLTRLLPVNIVGAHNLFEAARHHGIARVVLASSGQVNWWQQLDGPWPLRVADPYTPRHWYAVGKIFLESAGRAFAQGCGMAVVVARLGWCPRNLAHLAEVGATAQAPDIYLSPGDAGRFFRRAIEAPLAPGFAAVYVASRPVHQEIFDLQPAKELLGWEPIDQWPSGSRDGLSPG